MSVRRMDKILSVKLLSQKNAFLSQSLFARRSVSLQERCFSDAITWDHSTYSTHHFTPRDGTSTSHATIASKTDNNNYIWGEVLDHAVDLRTARPGDRIDIPYELTVSESMQDFWHSAFHAQDRISTSRPFARKIGLQDRILPFSLVLFLTSSMTHADSAKVQVGFGNASYHWPAFAGDTFKKSFQVKSIRNTSDGNHSVFYFTCHLINQRNRICMTADKRMLFEFPVPDSHVTSTATTSHVKQPHTHRSSHSPTFHVDPTSSSSSSSTYDNALLPAHLFHDHLVSQASNLHKLGSQSLTKLYPGQLIFHQMNRSLSLSQSQQLASLARLTHPRHFDTRRYDEKTEILIPGGLVLGIAMSAASRDLHEILHEELLHCNYVHSLNPTDCVSAMTFVKSVNDTYSTSSGDLETVVVRTIGLKNIDIVRDLKDKRLPLDLFTSDAKYTRDIEKMCKEKCPSLSNKIVVIFDRKILRQASRHEVFLL